MTDSNIALEIAVPALNEEAVIGETVERLRAELLRLTPSHRIVVVDNGSRDATTLRARAAGAAVITLGEHGKGRAVIEAARASGARIFGFIDADLSADPRDIEPLYRALERDECDIAIGSRLVDTSLVTRERLRTLSSVIFNTFRKTLLGISVKDTQCGLKLMNERGKATLSRCEETGWFFDMELLARAEHEGLRVHEFAIRWEEHRYVGRESRLRMVRDGFGAIVAMFRIRRQIK